MGPLGFADADGKIIYYHQPTRPHTVDTEFDVRAMTHLPRVDVVLSYVGADATMIDAAVHAGAKGIVSAATGAGRPTPAEDALSLRRATPTTFSGCSTPTDRAPRLSDNAIRNA